MVYYCTDFNPWQVIRELSLQKRSKGRQRELEKNFKYKDIVCAFDIETSLYKIGTRDIGTRVKPNIIDDFIAIMYIWQFQMGADITVYGRTWEEFNDFIYLVQSALEPEERILIFVHSLAYEWQFLRDPYILGAHLNKESVFCVKPRTPVRFLCFDDKLEFRCSYLHSNMSLDEYTKKMGVEHGKLSGDEFDYSKVRYSWTPLTARELEYCFNDVIGLVEAITVEMKLDHDNLYTIPLTSTGYVRREMKRAIAQLPYGYILKQLPDYKTYTLLRQAFRGGNTHASRFYASRRIDADIKCMDIASSYPNVLVNRKFPINYFRDIKPELREIDHITKLIKSGKAVLMELHLEGVELLDKMWPVPYLSMDKCRNIVKPSVDNGRILSADSLDVTLTDVDLQILLSEYDCSLTVLDAMFADYGYLPMEIRDVIRKYFKGKTELKNKGKTEEERKYYKMLYDKFKALLNACYGIMAQNPVKLEDCYIDGDYITGIHYKGEDGMREFLSEDDAEEREIDIYAIAHGENIAKSTMPYQWGVWCTAWAREALERAIQICGGDFLYCDTDSVYYYGDHDFHDYNQQAVENSTHNRAFATDTNGVVHYMGVLEPDKAAESFITLGAKKYAYINNGELHITIAGVSKNKGAKELEDFAKTHGLKDGLDALTEGFVFHDAGGTESVYNDKAYGDLTIDGRTIYVPSNVAIKPSTYQITIGDSKHVYRDLLISLLDNELFDLYRKNYEGAQLSAIEKNI